MRLRRAGEPGRGEEGRQAARLSVPAARRERESGSVPPPFPPKGGRKAGAGCRGKFQGTPAERRRWEGAEHRWRSDC